ncbi:hypothetical protein HKCCE3408_17625 [Rhodobacterales bacterium HKCCE3408]|nr:hypothetical protein [Rhodobacterales bacterium HKCCE3408]
MRRTIPALAVAIAALAGPALSQSARITGEPVPVPAGNDFADSLPPTLLRGASITLTAPARVTFTAIAAESGNANRFAVTGLGELTEDRDFGFARGALTLRRNSRLVGIFPEGPVDMLLSFTGANGAVIRPGSPAFAVFAAGAPEAEVTTFYIAVDDRGDGAGIDSDFDDFVIRVEVDPVR